MPLTPAQLATLKAFIDNPANGMNTQPNNADGHIAVRNLLNAVAVPDYFVWRDNVTRSEIYNSISPTASTWDWTLYKNQAVTEQNAWTQMFMGDQANLSLLNVRVGISKIFTAGASVQRDHCFAIGRKLATVVQKLFAIAVPSPPANSGNDGIAGNRGTATNPDLVVVASVTVQDVEQARNLP